MIVAPAGNGILGQLGLAFGLKAELAEADVPHARYEASVRSCLQPAAVIDAAEELTVLHLNATAYPDWLGLLPFPGPDNLPD